MGLGWGGVGSGEWGEETTSCQLRLAWVPAFAGMTSLYFMTCVLRLARLAECSVVFSHAHIPTPFVIPTEVGTHEANGKLGVAVGAQAAHAVFGVRYRVR